MQQESHLPRSIEDARNRLIIALDFPSAHLALDCVDRLEGTCQWVKVGLELYCVSGNSFCETLRSRGLNVFLDLKLHDIPNTVVGAIRSVSHTGASLLTIHALGGEAMLSAAAEAASVNANSPKLLAVTMLTSMDDQQMHGIGLDTEPAFQVLRLARLAISCGIEGIVCSSEETALLRKDLGTNPLFVVPGIRLSGEARGDQRRIATPTEAMNRGASMLVVGRPITQSADPAATTHAILTEMSHAKPNLRVKPP